MEIPITRHVSDGLKHFLSVNLNPLMIQLDNRIILNKNYTEYDDEVDDMLTGNANLYLGGLPNNHNLYKMISTIFPNNFDGCIDNFGTNFNNLIKNFNRFDGENIDICNGI